MLETVIVIVIVIVIDTEFSRTFYKYSISSKYNISVKQ
jgi:hypothetical protein